MNPSPADHQSKVRLTRRCVLAGLAATPVALSALARPWRSALAAEEAALGPADAIVIGAGAIGCNTAWHLRERGLKILVLDAQPEPAAQSTNGAAGFVSKWSIIHFGRWQKPEWEMQRYGIDFYTRLARRTKADIGFASCGLTYLYATPGGWKRAQPKIEEARALGTKLEVLDAARAKEIAPFLNFDKLSGVLYDPESIRVRAGDAIRALAAELASDGVRFRFNTRITDFLREGNQIVGVRVGESEIRSPRVIVTAGAWSRPLLAKLGVDCPATARNETRYVTKPLVGLPGSMPLLIFSDRHGHYIREERGGLLIGGGDVRPVPADREIDQANPPWCDKLPNAQAERVRKMVRESVDLMPIFDQANIDSTRSGLPTFTSDSLFIAGPVPGLSGLFMMSGCQEGGVTHGPALGRLLAELATDGKTTVDAKRYALERFKTTSAS